MSRSIVHKWFFEHDVDTVWEYLTDSELLAQWLMPNDFEPTVGHQFNFRTKPKVKFGFDGTVYCEVLEVVPKQKLSYSWKGGANGKTSLDTVVTWTLTSQEGGVALLLEHSGFKGVRNYLPYIIMGKGWLKIVKRLMKIIKLTVRIAKNF